MCLLKDGIVKRLRSLAISLYAVSYTHLDVYKRQDKANITAEDITKYRDSSTSYWLNCDKKKMLIKNMCAIDPTDAYIVQHFSTDPHILQETLFPSGKLNEVCSLPVSYTHLDVYKRQGGTAQPYVGTGGGGSTSELPWRDKDKNFNKRTAIRCV